MAEQICPVLQAFHGIYLKEGITQRYGCLYVLAALREAQNHLSPRGVHHLLRKAPCSPPQKLQIDEDYHQLSKTSAVTFMLQRKAVLSRSCVRPQSHAMATRFKCKTQQTQSPKKQGSKFSKALYE